MTSADAEKLPELEELKTSAVAVALTELPDLPHILAKNVGSWVL
jgi:hypothetical protein